MNSSIHDRGRGPEIAGTRITVFDVLYETQAGCSPAQIAELFQLTPAQVESALAYIAANRTEVEAAYRQIQERHARGNPPGIEEKLAEARQRLQAYKADRLGVSNGEATDAGTPGRH